MFKENLEQVKSDTCFQVLIQTARLIHEEGLARIRSKTNYDIRSAHLRLFPYIELEGSRLTDLAKATETTKQAVNQLVNELESMGLLERFPDPEDGRAKLITFSEEGRRSIFDGLKTLAEMEEEVLSSEEFASFAPMLTKLNECVRRKYKR